MANLPPRVTHNCTRAHGAVLAQLDVLSGRARTLGGSVGLSPEGYSQRCSCEPFTATQAQRAPTPFPPPGLGGAAALSYGWGSLHVRSFARRPHLFGKGGPPAGLPCGSQIPKFSTSSALPPTVTGGTLLAMCQPEGAKGVPRGGGCGQSPIRFHFYLEGGGALKGLLPCFQVPNREPTHGLHPRLVVAEIWDDRENDWGWGLGKGALVTGHSKEASLKTRTMTHHLRRGAAWETFFQKIFPTSPFGPSWVPIRGAEKGRGSREGARTTPPARANFPPTLNPLYICR